MTAEANANIVGVAGMEEQRAGEQRRRRDRRRATVLAILCLLLLVLCMVLIWHIAIPKGDTGAYIIPQGGMSSEEAQSLVDSQAEESRINVSVAPSMALKSDGSLRVNFLVEEPNNGWFERLEIEQDGRVVYASGAVAPGYGIEWCQPEEVHAGPAVATVHALDNSGSDIGNPVSVEVEVVAG